VAAERGIRFPMSNPDPGKMTIVEMSAGGAGFLDYDGDGWLDGLLLGLNRLALYRNDGKGGFFPVPDRAGLPEGLPWMGCAAGDFDGDGRVDLFLTGYDCARLYRNAGARFEDVTARSGIRSDRWYTSAAWTDLDKDGDLDLYAGAYVRLGPDSPRHCPIGVAPGGTVVTGPCGPEPYEPAVGTLYRNDGGRFTDVTRAAGLHRASGKTLGVAVADYDGDGLPDLYLANDRMPGDLFRNLGGLRFENVGASTGTAYNRDGAVQGGMGVDWGDFDGDGRLDLFVATYQGEPKSLYRSEPGGVFHDVSLGAGLAPARPYVAFGTRFFDADNDGAPDLFLANGHVLGPVEKVDRTLSYAQPMQLFHNRGDGTFRDVSAAAGEAFSRRVVGRAAAFGDFDNDGRVDILVANIEGEPVLLRNETEPAGRWLRVRVEGAGRNRAGIGARVMLRQGERVLVREVTTSSSYLASNDPRLHFGLGDRPVDEVTVRWPGGAVTKLRPESYDRELVIRAKGAANTYSR
jgi:hypothetical protein